MREPRLASVSNDKGVMVFADPADARGSATLKAHANANPGALGLWNHALRMHPWDVVIDGSVGHGELLVGADLPEGAHVVAFQPEAALLPSLERTLGGWSREVELVPSAFAAEVLVDRGFRSACARIGGNDVDATLAGAAGPLGGLDRWIVMVEILDLTPEQVATLVQHHNVYLHDTKTGHLIRLHSESPAVIHKLLASGWVYPGDALLMSSADMVPQW